MSCTRLKPPCNNVSRLFVWTVKNSAVKGTAVPVSSKMNISQQGILIAAKAEYWSGLKVDRNSKSKELFFSAIWHLVKLASGAASGCGPPKQMRHGHIDANWRERWICQPAQGEVKKRAACCFQQELGSQCFQQKKQPDFRVQKKNKIHKLQ